jgi:hypothetical protein
MAIFVFCFQKIFWMHHNAHKIITNNGDLVSFHGKKNTKKKQSFWVLEFHANKT